MNRGALALLVAGALATGGVISIGAQTFAQTSPTTTAPAAVTETQDLQDNDANVVLPTGGISEAQARAVITAQYPSLTIQSIRLEDENGTVVYGAKLSDGTEVTVNVTPPGTVAQETADQEGIEHQGGKGHGHAPLGGDGVVSSINGTTIVMTEETNEGGAAYTVDASSATVTKDGAASTLSSIAVGDKIFVQGTVNGTNVAATSIADGHRGGWGK